MTLPLHPGQLPAQSIEKKRLPTSALILHANKTPFFATIASMMQGGDHSILIKVQSSPSTMLWNGSPLSSRIRPSLFS